MILTKFISTILAPSLILFNNLNPISIIPQNPNDNVISLTRENKGIDKLIEDNNVIFYGETHNELDDKVQLEILMDHIRDIDKTDKIFLGLEMVTSDKQIILDQFNNGKIDSTTLLQALDWYNTWHYLPDGYKLVFDNARHNNIDLVAINAPTRFTELFKKGLSFNKEFIDIDNLKSFISSISQFHSLADKNAISKYYQINLLWETWMGSEIENYIRLYPDSKIIVYTGSQHSKNSGIPKVMNKLLNYKLNYINLTPLKDKDYFGEIVTEKFDYI